jgi:hypothetical protein
MKRFILLLSVLATFGTASYLNGATIPAGTVMIVSMADALSSHERPGRTFKATLANNVTGGGKVVLPAGTTCIGVVATSRNAMVKTTTSPLTIDLKSVSINGRNVPVKTTGAVAPDSASAAHGVKVRTGVTAGGSVVQHGTKLQFRLAQPLTI